MWSGRQLQLLNGSLHFSVLELASPIARGRGEFISSHIWNPEWRHLSLSQAPFRGHVKAPTKNTFCSFHGERFFCLAPAMFPRLRTSPEEELAIFSSQTHCPFACQNARLVCPIQPAFAWAPTSDMKRSMQPDTFISRWNIAAGFWEPSALTFTQEYWTDARAWQGGSLWGCT